MWRRPVKAECIDQNYLVAYIKVIRESHFSIALYGYMSFANPVTILTAVNLTTFLLQSHKRQSRYKLKDVEQQVRSTLQYGTGGFHHLSFQCAFLIYNLQIMGYHIYTMSV